MKKLYLLILAFFSLLAANSSFGEKNSSVLYIIPLAPEPYSIKRTEWVKWERDPIIGSLVSSERINCERKKISCLMPFEGIAVGFLMDSSKDLWTAAHNFESQLLFALDKSDAKKSQKAYNLILENFEPSFILLDGNLQILFDGRKSKKRPKALFIGEPIRNKDFLFKKLSILKINETSDQDLDFRKKIFDFMHISLVKSLDVPALKSAKKTNPSGSNKIFLADPMKSIRSEKNPTAT